MVTVRFEGGLWSC